MTTVSETKRADELTVGDKISEPGSGLFGVKAVVPFPGGVVVVLSRDTSDKPVSLNWPADRPVRLATDAELTAEADAARRAAFVAKVRAFADWFENRPWLPIPQNPSFQHSVLGVTAESIASARELAERLDVSIQVGERVTFSVHVGGVEYVLHGTVPEELRPNPAKPLVSDETIAEADEAHGEALAEDAERKEPTSCLAILSNGVRCDEPIEWEGAFWIHSAETEFDHDVVIEQRGQSADTPR